jgi:hypothetical protein
MLRPIKGEGERQHSNKGIVKGPLLITAALITVYPICIAEAAGATSYEQQQQLPPLQTVTAMLPGNRLQTSQGLLLPASSTSLVDLQSTLSRLKSQLNTLQNTTPKDPANSQEVANLLRVLTNQIDVAQDKLDTATTAYQEYVQAYNAFNAALTSKEQAYNANAEAQRQLLQAQQTEQAAHSALLQAQYNYDTNLVPDPNWTPQTIENLLFNSDFAGGTEGWSGVYPGWQGSSPALINGEVLFSYSNQTVSQGLYSGPFNNAVLTLSADWFNNETNRGFTDVYSMNIQARDINQNLVGTATYNSTGSHGWQNKSVAITPTGPVSYITVSFTGVDSGFWYGVYGPRFKNPVLHITHGQGTAPLVPDPLLLPALQQAQQDYADAQEVTNQKETAAADAAATLNEASQAAQDTEASSNQASTTSNEATAAATDSQADIAFTEIQDLINQPAPPAPEPEPGPTPEPEPEPTPPTELPAEVTAENLQDLDLEQIDPTTLTPEQAEMLVEAALETFETAEPGSPEYEQALDALFLAAEQDDIQLPTELAAIPGLAAAVELVNFLGNAGADMSPQVREESKKVVVTAVVAAGAAIQSAAAAASISTRKP